MQFHPKSKNLRDGKMFFPTKHRILFYSVSSKRTTLFFILFTLVIINFVILVIHLLLKGDKNNLIFFHSFKSTFLSIWNKSSVRLA